MRQKEADVDNIIVFSKNDKILHIIGVVFEK